MSQFFSLDCNVTISNITQPVNGTNSVSDGDESFLDSEFIWLAGVGTACVSSVATAIGTILQKKAHNIQEALPDEDKAPEFLGIVFNKMWLFALFIMVLVPLPFDFASYALAPASVILPMTGLTIVMTQVIAPYLLPEKLTKIEIIATFIILIGVGLTTTAAGGNTPDLTVCDLVQRYLDPDFFVVAAVMMGLVGLNIYWIHSRKHPKSLEVVRPQMYAFVAGGLGALMNVLFKATGELAKGSIGDTETNTWSTVHPYYHIVGVAVLAIGMISYINRGLQQYDAVIFTPMYFCNLICNGTLLGLIYYREYKGFETWQWVTFPLGILIVCVGIAFMALKGVDIDKVRKKVTKLNESYENRKSMALEHKEFMKHQRSLGRSRSSKSFTRSLSAKSFGFDRSSSEKSLRKGVNSFRSVGAKEGKSRTSVGAMLFGIGAKKKSAKTETRRSKHRAASDDILPGDDPEEQAGFDHVDLNDDDDVEAMKPPPSAEQAEADLEQGRGRSSTKKSASISSGGNDPDLEQGRERSSTKKSRFSLSSLVKGGKDKKNEMEIAPKLDEEEVSLAAESDNE